MGLKGIPTLKSGRIDPLYFLLGEDEYRKKEFIRELKRTIFPEDRHWVNYDYLLGGDASAADILDAVRTPAWDLFSEASPGGPKTGKLVVVDQAERISPHSWEMMEDYFLSPTLDACLVFSVHRRLKKWARSKSLPAKSVINFSPLRGNALIQWVKEEGRKRELILDKAVIQELLVTVGEDLQVISGELDKLMIYRGKGGRLSSEEVGKVTGSGRVTDIFALIDSINLGQRDAALTYLNALLEAGEAPLQILFMITRRLRSLWLGSEAWEKTRDSAAACRAGEVRYYRSEFIRQVKKFDLALLPFKYQRLLKANLDLKSGGANPKLILERLVVDLCGQPER